MQLLRVIERTSRRLVPTWICLAAVMAGAATPTVVFDMTRLTGAPVNRAITITLASQGALAVGTNIVFNTPLKLQPAGGTVSTVLQPANYWVAIDLNPVPMFMPVPDSTNTYNAIDLITDGLKHLVPPITNWFSVNGVLLYDPIAQTLVQGTATNVYSYWHGKTTNSNWKFYNADGFTQSTNCWTYPLDFSGLAAGSVNAGIQTNFLDDISLITREHGITAQHAWNGYVGMPVVFDRVDGLFFTNYVSAYTNPIPGVDIELVTFSNAAPIGVEPFYVLPTNALTCLPKNLVGGQVVWMRNNAGNAGAPHMNLSQSVLDLSQGGAVGVFGNADPLNPFYDGAATGGDSGSPLFVILPDALGNPTPVFLASLYAITEGPWVSWPSTLTTIQGLIGTNQLTFVDVSRYQNSVPQAPPNGTTNVHGANLPITKNLLRTDAVLVEKDLANNPTTQLIEMPDLLATLTNLNEWSSAVAGGGGGGGGTDIRPLNNIFTGSDTFSNTLTAGGSLNTFGTSQHFGPEYFTGGFHSQGGSVTIGVDTSIGAYALWFAGFGTGSHTNSLLYTFHNGPLFLYAGSNMDTVVTGSGATAPANPVMFQDNNGYFGGGGISNLNGSAISTGTVPAARLPLITESMQSLSDVTTWNVGPSQHGYVPKAPNNASLFLDGTGNWTIPPGGGGSALSASSNGVQQVTSSTNLDFWSTGDVLFTVSNRTQHPDIVGNLKATGTAGTYTKISFDAQGREIAGTTLSSGDIPSLAYVPSINGAGTNETFWLTGGTGFFNIYQTSGVLLLSVSNGVINFNTNVVINGTVTINNNTNLSALSNLLVTGWATFMGPVTNQGTVYGIAQTNSGIIQALQFIGDGSLLTGISAFPLQADGNGNQHAITNLSQLTVTGSGGASTIWGDNNKTNALTVSTSGVDVTNNLGSVHMQGGATTNSGPIKASQFIGDGSLLTGVNAFPLQADGNGNQHAITNLSQLTVTGSGGASTIWGDNNKTNGLTVSTSGVDMTNNLGSVHVQGGAQTNSGPVQASAFIGPVTGNVTGNLTGNATTATTAVNYVDPAIQTMASASNAISMSTNLINQWFFVASTAVSITNVTGSVAGIMTYGDITVSNSLATSITNYCTIPSAKFIGQISTNALVIPAGKEGFYHIECRGVNETNVFTCVQQ